MRHEGRSANSPQLKYGAKVNWASALASQVRNPKFAWVALARADATNMVLGAMVLRAHEAMRGPAWQVPETATRGARMSSYKIITTLGDFGPWVSGLVLGMPAPVRSIDVAPQKFNVFVQRESADTGQVVMARKFSGELLGCRSQGYVAVERAYACDGAGRAADVGSYVRLDFAENDLTRRMDNVNDHSTLRLSEFRVTQLQEIASEGASSLTLSGLVFDDCSAELCPELAGWELEGHGLFDGHEMSYAYFEPSAARVAERRSALRHFFGVPGLFEDDFWSDTSQSGRLPLVVWLHGAGEGGNDSLVTVTASQVSALSAAHIQDCLGGGAFVLVPTCPTYWMDSGLGIMSDDNQSIYVHALMQLIDRFVLEHADRVDPSRIYLGGVSNGGFMTCRLLADYPGYFAAGVAVCPPWSDALASEQEAAALTSTPLWLVHSANDPFVSPQLTSLATYQHLKSLGDPDVHLTYFDHLEDETLVYREPDGRPLRYLGHFAWIKAYHDAVCTEVDGSRVLFNGEPVTLWQWVGKHER